MANTTDFTNFPNERPNYFAGQYLLEDDFNLQHKYLSDRQRYYTQSLHVSGIIEGLEVKVDQNSKSVQVQSGAAIDSNGNLIILKKTKTFSDFKNITDGELYIQYEQKQQNPQQKDVADTSTRWIEEPILGFSAQTPTNSVKLAKLTIKNTITLDANQREYSGLSLPNSNSKDLTLRSGGNANPNLAVLTGSLKIDRDLTVAGTISGTIDTKNITSGILSVDRIPNLSADKINSGILSADRIPSLSANKITDGILSVDRIPSLSADKITSGTLSVDRIPSLSADKITSGTLSVDRIPNLSADKITSGTLSVDRIPNLSANKITSGTINGSLTVNGAITPSVGNTENNGIMFPKDPYRGTDDAAWIRYYRRGDSGEATTFEIATSDNADDHIALMSSGGVGIGTNKPVAKLEVKGGQTKLEQEAWQTPTFQNSWVNYDTNYNPAGYFKDSLGIVHLRGLVKSGNNNTTIFTLPDDYKPSKRELMSVQTYNNVAGRVDITNDGQVLVVSGNNAWISLDGITFRAA